MSFSFEHVVWGLESKVRVDLRAVDGFVATAAPTGAAGKEGPAAALMQKVADRNARGGLLLEMATKTKILIARNEHFLIYAAVGVVAGGAAFPESFVLEYEWPALRGMAFEAGFISGSLHGESTLDHPAFMRIMAVTATDLAFFNRMMIWQFKIAALFEMTLETSLGISTRIDNRVRQAARLIVDAAGSMAGFASNILRVISARHQPGVIGSFEFLEYFLMALLAALGADECGARDLRGRD